jgi:hypothetical protein
MINLAQRRIEGMKRKIGLNPTWVVCCAIALATLPISPVAAAEAPIVLGLGSQACGKWLLDRAENKIPAVAEESWVTGYVTAFNNYASETGNVSAGANITALSVWIDDYCKAHPLDSLFQASNALIKELQKKNAPK